MISYDDVEKARKVLGLPKEVSLAEIKAAYKKRLKEVHPDKRPQTEAARAEEETDHVVKAYETLMTYIAQYPYSFSKEQFKRVRRRDPTWAVTRFWKEMQET
ncbi:MAG: J domain-containing protein [Deltaproteobacteria bacterium]|nr:J domain-containing protein [Deltaproteobacteria bacterium]MBW2053733.1 J domain-containing protein [Deltaproteobacteria bacterium]MBW2141334.1 J domain-containing protein [Deltaproteobacteria bacterium]MBW2324670.1 J domain-containing protein [Deltaproteobacteria bacterium]